MTDFSAVKSPEENFPPSSHKITFLFEGVETTFTFENPKEFEYQNVNIYEETNIYKFLIFLRTMIHENRNDIYELEQKIKYTIVQQAKYEIIFTFIIIFLAAIIFLSLGFMTARAHYKKEIEKIQQNNSFYNQPNQRKNQDKIELSNLMDKNETKRAKQEIIIAILDNKCARQKSLTRFSRSWRYFLPGSLKPNGYRDGLLPLPTIVCSKIKSRSITFLSPIPKMYS
jgi:hypothetical protein